MHKGAGPEADALVSGYSAGNPGRNHRDLTSLRAGGELRNGAVNEVEYRLVARTGPFVFTSSLGGLHPLNLEEGTKSQPLSDAWFDKMAGGFGRKLDTEVRVTVATHYIPDHYCLAFVDFGRGHFVYSDPYFNFVAKHRDYDPTALAKLREHIQQGFELQEPFCDVSS